MTRFEARLWLSGTLRKRSPIGSQIPASIMVVARIHRFRTLLRTARLECTCELDVEGFATGRKGQGEVLIRGHEQALVYLFSFQGDDGKAYQLSGSSRIRSAEWIESLTIVPIRIRSQSGAVHSEGLLRFDIRSDLGKFLKNVRLSFF